MLDLDRRRIWEAPEAASFGVDVFGMIYNPPVREDAKLRGEVISMEALGLRRSLRKPCTRIIAYARFFVPSLVVVLSGTTELTTHEPASVFGVTIHC